MVQGDQFLLTIGAGAHFGSTANQDAHLPGTNLGKQFLLGSFRLGTVDVGNLGFRNPFGKQLSFQVIIDIERTVIMWSRQVAKNHLG